MRLGKVEAASEHYRRAMEKEPTSLAATYNYAYALSLMRDDRAPEHFRRAIELYEQQNLRRHAPSELANVYQAISHAYKGVGDSTKARKILTEALGFARKMPPKRRVFSSVQYRRISAVQFIDETKELLAQLGAGS